MGVPLTRPAPPRLSQAAASLRAIEDRGLFTNFGPVNTEFEARMLAAMFGGEGACLTVCNATIGLMLAIQNAIGERPTQRRYALMPSFTFAAAAQAADWVGLTPLFCDIDAADWSASAESEDALIRQYGDAIAVIVPYATMGNCIDLARYVRLSEQTGIPVVVDAAASLGSRDQSGQVFGAGCPFPIVFSMHATKTFSTGEGGVIHCGDTGLIETLRMMGNFGFGAPRSATMPGLNAKLSEVGALLALARLGEFESVVRHRERLAEAYRNGLPGHVFQEMRGTRCAYQFMPVLLPPDMQARRDEIIATMDQRGVGVGKYFAPHVAEQPHFKARGVAGDLSVTDHVSARILALPLWDEMTVEMVRAVCDALLDSYGGETLLQTRQWSSPVRASGRSLVPVTRALAS